MEPWFVMLYCVLCTAYVRLGYFSSAKTVKVLSKCLPVLLLWAWAWHRVKSEPDGQRPLLLVGLGVSVLGDALLVIPRVFPGGILAFAAAQVLYTALFWTFHAQLSTLWALITGVPILLVTFTITAHLWKKTPEHRLVGGVACVYFLLLSAMLWAALTRWLTRPTFPTGVGAAGALSFYISDVLIVASAFYSHWLLEGRTLVMTFYYLAQLLIVVSISMDEVQKLSNLL